MLGMLYSFSLAVFKDYAVFQPITEQLSLATDRKLVCCVYVVELSRNIFARNFCHSFYIYNMETLSQ